MSECDEQVLSAYVDGELDAAARQRVEAHLQSCAACTEEVRSLRETSRLLRDYPFADIDRDELARGHEAIDAAADQPVWRLGFTLGVIAASVLIVSCAWLMELPKDTRGVAQPVPTTVAKTTPAWEQMATTLKAEPLRSVSGDTSQTADARLDWMLNGLGGKNTHEEDAN